jgi:hypothetical protein
MSPSFVPRCQSFPSMSCVSMVVDSPSSKPTGNDCYRGQVYSLLSRLACDCAAMHVVHSFCMWSIREFQSRVRVVRRSFLSIRSEFSRTVRRSNLDNPTKSMQPPRRISLDAETTKGWLCTLILGRVAVRCEHRQERNSCMVSIVP